MQSNPLQAFVDGWSAQWQKERASSQMTLGKLISELEGFPPDRKISGLGYLMSYRGYYSDLAFSLDQDERTVANLLAQCKQAMGKVFEGYKGGDFQMGETTPLFVADYGSSGPRLMGLDASNTVIVPVTSPEDN